MLEMASTTAATTASATKLKAERPASVAATRSDAGLTGTTPQPHSTRAAPYRASVAPAVAAPRRGPESTVSIAMIGA